MRKKSIAFVCVNYDGFHFTRKMVESLSRQTGLGVEVDVNIYVVDNSPSVDSGLVSFCSGFDYVEYIRSEKNEGYFSGLNLGINSINTSEFDFVIACNNDLEFAPDFCSKLANIQVESTTQVICPDVVTLDGVHQNPHHLNALSKKEVLAFDCYFSNYYVAIALLKLKAWLKRLSLAKGKRHIAFAENVSINQGVGACYILTRNFFKLHKELFFPSFLYGEEATLSWQVRSSGGHLVFNKDLVVAHAESAALSRLPARQTYEFGKKSYWIIRKYLF